MKATTNVDLKLLAPIKVGDNLGAVNVMLRDKIITSKPLIALNAIEKGSFLQRAYDSALMLLK